MTESNPNQGRALLEAVRKKLDHEWVPELVRGLGRMNTVNILIGAGVDLLFKEKELQGTIDYVLNLAAEIEMYGKLEPPANA